MMHSHVCIEDIFSKFYTGNKPLLSTVSIHSEAVAGLALQIADVKNLDLDRDFVREAALLHDIGVVRCDAPGIHCHGSLPYICHGVEGRKMLDGLGLERHALVCERHTGSGLTVDDIIRQKLPLPARDMCPQTLEEKIICYADKFFSKSGNLTEKKSLQKVISQMEKFGPDSLNRFMALHEIFAS